jgi:hypothetical protein
MAPLLAVIRIDRDQHMDYPLWTYTIDGEASDFAFESAAGAALSAFDEAMRVRRRTAFKVSGEGRNIFADVAIASGVPCRIVSNNHPNRSKRRQGT